MAVSRDDVEHPQRADQEEQHVEADLAVLEPAAQPAEPRQAKPRRPSTATPSTSRLSTILHSTGRESQTSGPHDDRVVDLVDEVLAGQHPGEAALRRRRAGRRDGRRERRAEPDEQADAARSARRPRSAVQLGRSRAATRRAARVGGRRGHRLEPVVEPLRALPTRCGRLSAPPTTLSTPSTTSGPVMIHGASCRCRLLRLAGAVLAEEGHRHEPRHVERREQRRHERRRPRRRSRPAASAPRANAAARISSLEKKPANGGMPGDGQRRDPHQREGPRQPAAEPAHVPHVLRVVVASASRDTRGAWRGSRCPSRGRAAP